MKELLKALSAFQQEVPIIHKDSKGYNYKYTNLATIFEVITPILKKHGIGFTQPLNENNIKTIIYHIDSGEMLESNTNLPVDSLQYVEVTKKDGTKTMVLQGFEGMNKAQAYGSLITYFRRYSLASILGLITDDDADARNKRLEETELLDELKALAKEVGVSITDLMITYKKIGYEKTLERLKSKQNEI